MSSTVQPASPPPPPGAATGNAGGGAANVVDQRIHQTSRQVKWVDLGVVTLRLTVLTILYLLALTAVDHWLMPLGAAARWVALLGLLGLLAFNMHRYLLPLLLRRINPVYAARTIETGTPTLKNSLVNYLLLRGNVQALAPGMYSALESRAVEDVQAEHVDAAVDKTSLIRYGYVFAAVLSVAAIYKAVSPKDPLQSLQRVFMPWARVDAPTRFEITAVTPGDQRVYLGQRQTVSATVAGTAEPESVELEYATTDGRQVDQRLAMRRVEATESGIVYQVELFADRGLDSSLRYRVHAGDATSATYQLDVVAAPLIQVESVQYRPPSYTGDPTRMSTSPVIRGLEGTEVTIRAKANLPLQSAQLLFDVPETGPAADQRYDSLPMNVTGQTATARLQLQLQADRRTAEHSNYCIVFTTSTGKTQADAPVTYPIAVDADLAPVVEILTPQERRVEVPQDRSLKLEVRAVDPDYGLRLVRLQGVKNGQMIVDEILLEDPRGVTGQVVKSLAFTPQRYRLAVGDIVRFRGLAEDNRHWEGVPAANSDETDEYEIVITEPIATPIGESARNGDPQEEEGLDGEQTPQPAQPDQQSSGDPGQDNTDNKNREQSSDAEGGKNKPQEAPSDDTKSQGAKPEPGKGEPPSSKRDDQQSKSPPEDGQQEDGQQSEAGEESGGGQSGAGGQNGGKQGGKQQGDGAGAAGDEGEPADGEPSNSAPSSGESRDGAGGGRSQTGRGGNSPGQAGEQAAGEQAGEQDGEPMPGRAGERGAAQDPSGGGSATQENGTGQPANEDLHDGDVIERLEKLVRQLQEKERTDGQSDSRDGGERRPNQTEREPRDSQGNGTHQDGASRDRKSSGDEPTGAEQEAEKKDNADPKNADPKNADGNDVKREGGSGQRSANGGRNSDTQSENDPSRRDQKPNGDPTSSGDSTAPKDATPNNNAKGTSKDQDRDDPTGRRDDKSSDETNSGPNSGANFGNKPNEQPTEQPTERSSGDTTQATERQDENDASAPRSPRGAEEQAGDAKSEDRAGQGGDRNERNAPSSRSGDKRSSGERGPSSEKTAGEKTAGENSADDENKAGGQNNEGPNNDGQRAGGGAASDRDGSSSGAARDRDKRDSEAGQRSRRASGNGESPIDGEYQAGQDVPPYTGREPEYLEEKGNLDYAEKSTDLVLDYLRDQKDQPNQQLLDELNWSEEDLREFVDRWDKLKRESTSSPQGKQRWNDALKSLGLNPTSSKMRQTRRSVDASGGNSESGGRSQPPAKYLRQFKAFRKSAAKGEE